MYARLIGTGSCLPGNPVTNNDLAARGIDTNDEWIVTRTGIRSRYPGRAGYDFKRTWFGRCSASAWKWPMLPASDLDLIIVATSTPDFHFSKYRLPDSG
jgi:3-oxoacyl-[acyl-carrier-protein] synthase-3